MAAERGVIRATDHDCGHTSPHWRPFEDTPLQQGLWYPYSYQDKTGTWTFLAHGFATKEEAEAFHDDQRKEQIDGD